MFAKPQAEHSRLEHLVGTFTYEHECVTGPDTPPHKASGKIVGRTLGGLWYLFESEGGEGAESWSSVMTLGFDPEQGKYVGSFIGSMMTNLWVYGGTYDEATKRITLDTVGPKMDPTGTAKGTAKYQDIVELVDKDHWNLYSQILGDDGKWAPFMTGRHVRVG